MWCIMTSGEEPSVIQGCLIQCNSWGASHKGTWEILGNVISTLGCCPRATLLGDPMTFTKMRGWTKVSPCPLFWESPPPKRPHDIHKMQGWTKVPPCPLFWESPPPDLGCNIHRTNYIFWILYPTRYNIFGESSSIQTHSYNWANIVLHEIAKIYWNKSKFAYIELIRNF